jgi:hypothetical protein
VRPNFKSNPFRYFNSSSRFVHYPLSLRNVEDPFGARRVDIS